MLTAMLDRKYRGRRKGVDIRQGSVRQARFEAKLSLAQVAGGQVSRTAIHLIETGRTRPSAETLEHIASRTGKPIDFFLVAPDETPDATRRRDELHTLEGLTLRRNFATVVEVGDQLLKSGLDSQTKALVHFYIGQAHCRLVRPHQALQHLAAARGAFDQFGDEWMAVEALDWESSALGLLEDPRAIPLAHEALERCRRLDPRPALTEARILGHIANMYVVSHSWSEAIRYYEAAVEAAGNVKDLLQMAKMHHGLGTAYQRLQQPARARQHFDKALTLYSIESDLSSIYRVENDLGELLLRQGQLESAEQHLRTALAGSSQLAIDRRGRGYILANLGEVSLQRGQIAEAKQYLMEAMDVSEAVDEKVVSANVQYLLGKVEESQGQPHLADEHFDTAIRILESLEMPDRLLDCHMEYAKLLERRGDLSSAAQHWKLAAEFGNLARKGPKSTRDRTVADDGHTFVLSEKGHR